MPTVSQNISGTLQPDVKQATCRLSEGPATSTCRYTYMEHHPHNVYATSWKRSGEGGACGCENMQCYMKHWLATKPRN